MQHLSISGRKFLQQQSISKQYVRFIQLVTQYTFAQQHTNAPPQLGSAPRSPQINELRQPNALLARQRPQIGVTPGRRNHCHMQLSPSPTDTGWAYEWFSPSTSPSLDRSSSFRVAGTTSCWHRTIQPISPRTPPRERADLPIPRDT